MQLFRSDNIGSKLTEKFTPARTLVALLAIGLTFSSVAASAQEVGSYASVDAKALNLRTAPDAGSSVIRALPFGTSVSVLDHEGGWAKIFVQGAGGTAAEGWVATRFLRQSAGIAAERRRPTYDRQGQSRPADRGLAPLRVSKLDFDCRPALFGNSGIRKCLASVRVQLSPQEFDPNRSDHVFIACHGTISYRTDTGHGPQRLAALERHSISRNDRLGQSVRVNFPIQSENEKIVSAHLVSFACGRD